MRRGHAFLNVQDFAFDLIACGPISAATRFRIELTADQLASMGATLQPNQSSEEIDVTEFVRQGQLTIRGGLHSLARPSLDRFAFNSLP
jgi:hypothetical protein